jgi:poly(3-hydroxybutyrate) depolymerase
MCSRVRKSLFFAIVLIVTTSTAICAGVGRRAQIHSHDKQLSLNISGIERMYLLHPPPSLPAKKVPRVMAFHGGGSHAANTPKSPASTLWLIARASSVAYPESFNRALE